MNGRPQEGDAPLEEAVMEGQESDDMMAADRVMAVDEGKEAFQDMVAAVNNADERVKALNEDLDKAISNAVSILNLFIKVKFIHEIKFWM